MKILNDRRPNGANRAVGCGESIGRKGEGQEEGKGREGGSMEGGREERKGVKESGNQGIFGIDGMYKYISLPCKGRIGGV